MGQFTSNEIGIKWSLGEGSDKDKFSIDESTGTLVFNNAPDFENPNDSDNDNIYLVNVIATDPAQNQSNQNVTITILNDTHKGEVSKEKLIIGEKEFEIAIKGGQLGKDIETKEDHKFEIQENVEDKLAEGEKDKINDQLNKKGFAFKIEVPKIKKNGEDVLQDEVVSEDDLVGQKATVALPLELLKDDDKEITVEQKFSYHGIKEKKDNDGNGTGEFEIIDMTYDSSTKQGARFFDTDNDKIVDFIHIGIVDGGPGDKDGKKNGEIDDPSTFGTINFDAKWLLSLIHI